MVIVQNNREIPLKEQNIVLIGFMGVGKTTIGSHLARKLYRDFVDIDQEIEREYNMPTTEIFKTYGEKRFREIEKEHILKLCSNTRLKIISVGGGAFLQEEVKQACLASSIVFFLDLNWDSWKDRLKMLIDTRPNLQNKTLGEIEDLFRSRQDIYAVNHSKIDTDQLDAEEVADYIIQTLNLGWELYEPTRGLN